MSTTNEEETLQEFWDERRCELGIEMPDIELYKSNKLLFSQIVQKKLSENLVYCNKEWYAFIITRKVWEVIDSPTIYISLAIKNEFNKEINFHQELKEFANKHDMSSKLISRIGESIEFINSQIVSYETGSVLSLMEKYLKQSSKINQPDFTSKLDTKINFLVFNNGILNLKTKEFREGLSPEDYITKKINMDYSTSTPEEINQVKEIIYKICNANESHLEYFSSVIGYSLLGDAQLEKSFYSMVGLSGNNGKTTIIDSLYQNMPCYVAKVNSEVFCNNAKNRHKHIKSFKGSRIIYVEEMIDESKLDAAFLKEVADGKSISYEVLYGNTVVDKINAKIITIGNNTPTFKTDGGIKIRYRELRFNSYFSGSIEEDNYETLKFIADKKLTEKLIGELAMPLINYFVNYSMKYYEKGLEPMPEEWVLETNETIDDNNAIALFVDNYFEKGLDYKLQVDEVEHLLKDKNFTKNTFKNHLKMIGINYNKSLRKNNKRGCWPGIRLVVNNFNDSDSD